MSLILSVITVVLNRAAHLPIAIDSVRKINDSRLEYIVVDGGSHDGTVDVLSSAEDVVSKWVSESDDGIYQAINKGLSLSSGQYVSILGSDDCYIPDEFGRVLDRLEYESPDVLCAPIRKKAGHEWRTFLPKPDRLTFGMTVPHPGTFIRKSISQSIGYDETYMIAADYKHLLEIRKAGFCFEIFDSSVLMMSDQGVSNQQLHLSREEIKRVQRECLPVPVYCCARMAAAGWRIVSGLSPRD